MSRHLIVAAVIALATMVAGKDRDVVNSCFDVKSESSCTQFREVIEGESVEEGNCEWCICSAVPSSCVSKHQAKGLPPTVFVCPSNQNKTAIVEAPKVERPILRENIGQCYRATNESACGLSEDNVSSCVWCESKTFNNLCVNKAQAKNLEKQSFQCNY